MTIERACHHLQSGRLVIFPTETVWGIGADATAAQAVEQIFALKGRPRHNPLIIHCRDLAQAQQYGRFDGLALRLAAAFWPGPLTLVVPQAGVPLAAAVTAGLPTVAIRVPSHPVARALLAVCPHPIAAPSANLSGLLSATRRQDIDPHLARHAYVLEGDQGSFGLESTIVKPETDRIRILRQGGLPGEALARIAPVAEAGTTACVESPGQLLKHYAPRHTRLRLAVTDIRPGEAQLAFGTPLPGGVRVCNLSINRDLVEAGRNLYAMLHTLDVAEHTAIAVMPIPDHGVGVAINDRLHRGS